MTKKKPFNLLNLAIAAILLSGLLLYVVSNKKQDVVKTEGSQVIKVDPDEFDRLASDKKAFVLDVHTPEQAHLPQTDAFIPYNEIGDNLDKLPQDKSTPILVYCRSGSMSAEAAQVISEAGYRAVYDLEGGTGVYRESRVSVDIYPTQIDLGTVIYGEVAETSFFLVNNTPAKLDITRVSTSCGCTTATVEKETLEPYEETVINVAFDPAFHKDDTDVGDIIRTIYIDTDNPNFGRVTADITANVIKN